MAVRAVWILGVKSEDNVLYSRKFPSVEKLAQRFQKTSYVPLPSENEFSKSLIEALALEKSPEFKLWRDDCQKECKLPVIEVPTEKGVLGPILIIDQFGVFFCCLTYDKCDANQTLKPIQMPSISLGFSILTNIIDYVGPTISTLKSTSPKFKDLDGYISFTMPFGKPSNLHVDSLFQSCNQPWKAALPSGRPTLSFQIMETVRSMQHPQNEILQLQIYGTVTMKAELEDYRYDIALKLSHDVTELPQELQTLVYHPCIQPSTTAQKEKIFTLNYLNQPLPVTLFHYLALPEVNPPISGVYKMRETEALHIELQLQLFLNPKVKNTFETLEAFLPFNGRGTIDSIDVKPTEGVISIVDGRSALQWTIGNSFPAKTLEHCLIVTLQFTKTEDSVPLKDPFCTGANAYAQIKIKQTGTTISGTKLGFHSISPTCKPKINYEQEVKSADYKIWNEFGKIPFPKMV